MDIHVLPSKMLFCSACPGPFRLTHRIVMDSSTVICWMCPFVILEMSGLYVGFSLFFIENPISKHYVASDLGLHCLPMTLFTGFYVRMG